MPSALRLLLRKPCFSRNSRGLKHKDLGAKPHSFRSQLHWGRSFDFAEPCFLSQSRDKSSASFKGVLYGLSELVQVTCSERCV